MQYIEEFKKALEKRSRANRIKYSIKGSTKDLSNEIINSSLAYKMPDKTLKFLLEVNGIEIISPRELRFLSISELRFEISNYLVFAIINNNEVIAFDTSKINQAEEWDIINIRNEYIITKTVRSFLTNKVWAWIDRGRPIWEQEIL